MTKGYMQTLQTPEMRVLISVKRGTRLDKILDEDVRK
jgi:hypothetical protein